jgi:hypothetical protein
MSQKPHTGRLARRSVIIAPERGERMHRPAVDLAAQIEDELGFASCGAPVG